MNTDPNTIKSVSDVTGLRAYCVRYNEEMSALEGILPTIYLGLLQLKQGTFKEEVIPICRDLLLVLDAHVPKYCDFLCIFYNTLINNFNTELPLERLKC